jgi:hypothetical protein
MKKVLAKFPSSILVVVLVEFDFGCVGFHAGAAVIFRICDGGDRYFRGGWA